MEKIGTATIKGIDYILYEFDNRIIYFPVIIDKENKISEILERIGEQDEKQCNN